MAENELHQAITTNAHNTQAMCTAIAAFIAANSSDEAKIAYARECLFGINEAGLTPFTLALLLGSLSAAKQLAQAFNHISSDDSAKLLTGLEQVNADQFLRADWNEFVHSMLQKGIQMKRSNALIQFNAKTDNSTTLVLEPETTAPNVEDNKRGSCFDFLRKFFTQ